MNEVNEYLYHHGILGQKWGRKNGPPYPLERSGKWSTAEKNKFRKKLDKIDKTSPKMLKAKAKADRLRYKANTRLQKVAKKDGISALAEPKYVKLNSKALKAEMSVSKLALKRDKKINKLLKEYSKKYHDLFEVPGSYKKEVAMGKSYVESMNIMALEDLLGMNED